MKKCVLGDVAKRIQTGPFGSQLHQSDYSPSGTPVVMPKDLADGGIVDATIARVGSQHVERLAKHKLQAGDLLFSRRGDVGRCALVRKEQEGWLCGTGCLRVELNAEKADYNYLYYFLRRDDAAKWLESHAVGAIMLNINPAIVSQLPIALPPLDVQRNIAKILSTIDRKIALNRKRIATLEAMAKEIYDYWFVQFDFPDAHGRPYKSSGGAMVYNPDLKREIPKGWEVGVFSDLIDFTMGQSPAGPTLNESGDGVLFFQGSTDFGSFFPSPRQFTNSPVRMAKAGDVLLSVRAPVGTLNFAFEDCCIGRGIGAFRGKIVSNLFTWFYLKSLRPYFDSKNVAGTTFGSIGKDDFKMLKSAIPLSSILRAYSDLSDCIFEQMKLCERAIINDQKIRDFLLPLLMNGQVKVG